LATASAVSRLVEETTAAVGCSFAISSARLGPDATAMRSRSISSTASSTSLIRRPVPFSTPFIRLVTGTSAGMSSRICSRFCRSDWLGTETKTNWASFSAAPTSEVAVTADGRFTPGR
jgi:hypothetical protein